MLFADTLVRAEAASDLNEAAAQGLNLYIGGRLCVVVWQHGGKGARSLELKVSNQRLPKPYLGARLSQRAAVIVALLDTELVDRRVPVAMLDDRGEAFLRVDRVVARSLDGLGARLASEAGDYQGLVENLLYSARRTVSGWTSRHQEALRRALDPARRPGSRGRDASTKGVQRGPVAASAGEELVIYAREQVIVAVFRHGGRDIGRQFELVLEGEPVAKPYLGTMLGRRAVGFVALVDRPLRDRAVPARLHGADGKRLNREQRAPVRPLKDLRENLPADVTDLAGFVDRIRRRAGETIIGWTERHRAIVESELGDAQRPLPAAERPPRAYRQPDGNANVTANRVIDGPPTFRAADARASVYLEGHLALVLWHHSGELVKKPRISLAYTELPRPYVGVAVNSTDAAFLARLPESFSGSHVALSIADATGIALTHSAAMPVKGIDDLRFDYPDAAERDRWLRRLLDQAREVIEDWSGTESRQLQRLLDDDPAKDRSAEPAMPAAVPRSSGARVSTAGPAGPAIYPLAAYADWFADVYSRHVGRAPTTMSAEPSPLTVVVPVAHGVSVDLLEQTVDGILRQLDVAGPVGSHVAILCQASGDGRCRVVVDRHLRERRPVSWLDVSAGGLAGVLKELAGSERRGHVWFLLPGERLAEAAVVEMQAAATRRGASLLYGDSDTLTADGRHHDPEFRPDYNPDLLLANPYIGSFAVECSVLAEVADRVSELPGDLWRYDLLLHCTELVAPARWSHVARVLTHRLLLPGAAHAAETEPDDVARPVRALLGRQRIPAQVTVQLSAGDTRSGAPRRPHDYVLRTAWPLPKTPPRVSIIVPTRDRADLVTTCLRSLLERTDYADFEILLVDNDSVDPDAKAVFDRLARHPQVRLLQFPGPFNWSAINNFAVREASGQVLCFLNNDTEVVSAGWLREMVSHAIRPGIGAVGARLLFRDRTLQHGGVIVGASGAAEHAFTGLALDEPGYMNRAVSVQNLSAVTGACLVCRRQRFDEMGGFNAADLPVAFNDVDFCLRLVAAGYRNLWTPHAVLFHDAKQSRGEDDAGAKRRRVDGEMAYLASRWPAVLARDPCYNPAFALDAHPYTVLASAPYPALADDG